MGKDKTMVMRIVKEELFNFLSAALLVFFLLELIWPNIILAYFNLNWLLVAWAIMAVWLLKK